MSSSFWQWATREREASSALGESLARDDNARTLASRRETELAGQVEDLTSALGGAYVELRVWRKKGALYPRSRSSS